MNPSLAAKSLVLFGASLLFLLLLTLFETWLIGLPEAAERLLSAMLLILPGILGVVLGALSLRRNEQKSVMAVAGIILNALFALFHMFVLMLAG